MTDPRPVILFDAKCVLCSANVQFILARDRARHFRMASMQGGAGGELSRRHGVDPARPDSILLIESARVLRESDAVIAIFARLGWPWRIAALARVVPRWLRDPAYRVIARNRYRLFGKRDSCWLPRPEDADRFL